MEGDKEQVISCIGKGSQRQGPWPAVLMFCSLGLCQSSTKSTAGTLA